MSSKTGMAWSLMTAIFGAALLSCAAADEIESQIDCHDICSKYAECYDSDYDVSACREECENEVDEDPDYMSKVDACDDCIGSGDSCLEDTFKCADECVGIVP